MNYREYEKFEINGIVVVDLYYRIRYSLCELLS
jgi:hypothetical protein